jgi:hypothetical protein
MSSALVSLVRSSEHLMRSLRLHLRSLVFVKDDLLSVCSFTLIDILSLPVCYLNVYPEISFFREGPNVPVHFFEARIDTRLYLSPYFEAELSVSSATLITHADSSDISCMWYLVSNEVDNNVFPEAIDGAEGHAGGNLGANLHTVFVHFVFPHGLHPRVEDP